MERDIVVELSSKGYWPATAMEYLRKREYSKAVELCTIRLKDYPDLVSGRVVLARALYHSGQSESAEQEFYRVLRRDPDNLVALKYLGDLKFGQGDEATAFSYYMKVLEIDPQTGGLASLLEQEEAQKTHVLTLKRGQEKETSKIGRLREIPFKTETMGDLLLKQGHSRLALEIFRELADESQDQRLVEKYEKTRQSLNMKEKNDVSKSN
ncbi:MAG: tetratricopeptide repeat protein [Candidatus Zixiibacteriota bacterium]|nr:MAG: tetratricopeptide repeat protein [candidate division Zixibacteria bacterium]